LGNVQATVSDKRYVQKQYLSTTDSLRKGFAVAVRALYDYYPFGMPMKERSTSDTTTQSVYMSQVVYSPQYTKVNNAMSGASITSLNTTASTNYNGSINYTGQSASISKVLSSLLPNVPVQMKIDLLYTNKPLYLAIQQGSAASPSVYTNLLYSTTMNSSGTYTISFTPTQSSVQLSIAYSYFNTNANTLCFTLDSVNYQQQSASVSSTQLVQVSNKINDGYRFGYNGQEKVDEIAGAGNHTTALFWEYDTRLGRRWNLDPVPQIAISDYAVNRSNPIYNNDPDGDCPNCITAAIGAGVGALIGGAIEIGSQLYNNGSINDWKAVGGNVTQGFVTGGAAGFTGGTSLLTTAIVAGTANGVGGIVNRTIQGKSTSVMNVVNDVSIGAVFGAGSKYLGDKFGQLVNKTAPNVDDIFTNSISSRGLAEKLAQVTKYKGFQNANEVFRKNNPVFDLFDNTGNVVDITTTSAQKLGTSQFTSKLDALAGLSSQFKNRTLQIYVKAGQYSKEELSSLTGKLQNYIKDNKMKNVKFSIDQVKK
jgi:hypothetical protein